MPDNENIARDLTIVHLQSNYDKNLSPEDLIKVYKETYKKFEDALKEPVAKVQILDRHSLF
ncbi:hypothetical protein ACTFIN_01770 [Clostridium cagae]|uniref:hypothetical protein n=1 Tax=Clostridium cagae TaxID=2080751 RepID=UPI003F76F073